MSLERRGNDLTSAHLDTLAETFLLNFESSRIIALRMQGRQVQKSKMISILKISRFLALSLCPHLKISAAVEALPLRAMAATMKRTALDRPLQPSKQRFVPWLSSPLSSHGDFFLPHDLHFIFFDIVISPENLDP